MKNKLLLLFFCISLFFNSYSQTKEVWTSVTNKQSIQKSKNAQRESFPTTFSLIQADNQALMTSLSNVPSRTSASVGVEVLIPNLNGALERFEVFEASNFDEELQIRFPQIKSYVGKGIDNPSSSIRFSMDHRGFQAMIFRSDKRNEFIEPYSEDGSIYAIFESERVKGKLPFTCSTEDKTLSKEVLSKGSFDNSIQSGGGQLLNFRLALSCNGEYSNYFGATSAAQVANVLAAFNATMTRVNGVFEKDFGIHMNIVAQTTNVIFYNPATDPYTTLANWNTQLQQTLNTTLSGPSTPLATNNALYDVGHMFGASGGGGNAGCIGCVCVDGVASGTGATKGRGITSPADGNPSGDTFDIDYVAHELGHQFGANHTFSMSNEGAGVNVEPGSGSTIMGYAGITAQDVQPNSDDYFHYVSINQVEVNMVGKTCPQRVTMTNSTPVANAGRDYTIPFSTPFILTGTATDADSGDILTYCWEQVDDGVGQTGASSAASATKTTGPNWRSYDPTLSPSRYCPPLNRVVANQTTTPGTEITVEALSSVARILNFAFTVRDNATIEGQTNTDLMRVTVSGVAGPFTVSSPNTAVSWQAGTNQNVTWNVAGTTANGVNAAFVDIFLSTDGGFTYPIQLASKVPNDGSETITVPNVTGTQNRIMVKGWDHIFYDISNTNFTITAPSSSFLVSFNGVAGEQNKAACQGANVTYTIPYTALSGFSGTTNFSVSGQPAGSTAVFSPTSMSSNGNVTLTISNTSGSTPQFYALTVTANSGAITRTVPFYLDLLNANFGTQTLTLPTNGATGQNSASVTLNWAAIPAATSYQLEVATDAGFTNIIQNIAVATNSYNLTGLSDATTYYWRVKPFNSGCEGLFSTSFQFQTGQTVCNVYNSTNVPIAISASGTPTINSTLNIPSGASISDINVTMDITHTWLSDLTVTLESPLGTQVILFQAQCGSSDNAQVTFDDSGSPLACGGTPALSGTLAPQNPLSTFNGQNSTGTWILRIADGANLDGGSLNSWSLNICANQPLSTEDFNTSNVLVYPNPNNGSFTIELMASSSTVEIDVFDIRGRKIVRKSLIGNQLIQEKIELQDAEKGVYLINISDGNKRITKKIIVK